MDAENLEDQDAPKPRRRFRLSRNLLRVLSINVVFGVLIGAGLYATTERTALLNMIGFSGAGGISGLGQSAAAKETEASAKPVPVTAASSLAPDDPVLQFARTRIGHVLFPSAATDNCQRKLFNNLTGVSLEVPSVFCGQKVDQVVEADSPSRLQSLRASFTKGGGDSATRP